MRKAKFIALLTTGALLLASVPVCAGEKHTEPGPQEEYSIPVTTEEIKVALQETAVSLEKMDKDSEYAAQEAFFKAGNEYEANSIAEQYGATIVCYENGIGVLDLGRDVTEVMEEKSHDQSVNAMIYPNYYCTVEEETGEDTEPSGEVTAPVNDPKLARQWFHSSINDAEAWKYTKGSGALIAIVDTGADTDHEDLSGNIISTSYTVANVNSPEDINGHGTHVAGIAAALCDNELGGCGVAPEAKLHIARVGSSSNITVSTMISGIYDAVDSGANVINISLCTSPKIDKATIALISNAVDYAYDNGAVVIASAGNYGRSDKYYPAAIDKVIAVANFSGEGKLAETSNYGEWVDLGAPGTGIHSTYINNNYADLSGTSMSSPVVTGVAALVYAANPEFLSNKNSDTVDKVSEILLNATDGTEYSYGSRKVTGMIDALKAVKYAVGELKIDDKTEDSGNEDNGNKGSESSNSVSDDDPDDNKNSDNKDDTGNGGNDGNDDTEDPGDTKNPDSTDEPEDNSSVVTSPVELVKKTVSLNGGISAEYYAEVYYTGKKLKLSDLDISLTVDGQKYAVSRAKIRNGTHAGNASVLIKKLSGAGKETNAKVKGITLNVQIDPCPVSRGSVTVALNGAGNVKSVKYNGKKVKKSMYGVDTANKEIIFTGDYTGTASF
ncbi:Serine protease, subtilisin family [Lachnospiraceae bacterium KH1T2]|nr:Serine protease, subtilisin family [Lachnospiraceae bacterium KH1T2]